MKTLTLPGGRIIGLPTLYAALAVCLGTGAAAALLALGHFSTYQSLTLPPLAPPSAVFPVVWTVLYGLMALSLSLVYESRAPMRRAALLVAALQLLVNAAWVPLFFRMQAFALAFWELCVLLFLVIAMLECFLHVDPLAALLQVPYLLWTAFACYLNLGVVLLN